MFTTNPEVSVEDRIRLFRPTFGEAEKKALCDTIDSRWVGRGPRTIAFEERFADYIGTSYADGQLDSYFCAGLTKAECTLVRINDGSMPDGAGCGGPVADDAANAASCVTVSEVAILQAWIDGGMLE